MPTRSLLNLQRTFVPASQGDVLQGNAGIEGCRCAPLRDRSTRNRLVGCSARRAVSVESPVDVPARLSHLSLPEQPSLGHAGSLLLLLCTRPSRGRARGPERSVAGAAWTRSPFTLPTAKKQAPRLNGGMVSSRCSRGGVDRMCFLESAPRIRADSEVVLCPSTDCGSPLAF
jgi:hypothetical protein